MGFKPGEKRHPNAGRKPGSRNKSSFLVKDILENEGINLVEMITELLPQVEPVEQLRALVQLMPYCYPRLAQHEVSVTNPYLDMPKEQLEQEVKDRFLLK